MLVDSQNTQNLHQSKDYACHWQFQKNQCSEMTFEGSVRQCKLVLSSNYPLASWSNFMFRFTRDDVKVNVISVDCGDVCNCKSSFQGC